MVIIETSMCCPMRATVGGRAENRQTSDSVSRWRTMRDGRLNCNRTANSRRARLSGHQQVAAPRGGTLSSRPTSASRSHNAPEQGSHA